MLFGWMGVLARFTGSRLETTIEYRTKEVHNTPPSATSDVRPISLQFKPQIKYNDPKHTSLELRTCHSLVKGDRLWHARVSRWRPAGIYSSAILDNIFPTGSAVGRDSKVALTFFNKEAARIPDVNYSSKDATELGLVRNTVTACVFHHVGMESRAVFTEAPSFLSLFDTLKQGFIMIATYGASCMGLGISSRVWWHFWGRSLVRRRIVLPFLMHKFELQEEVFGSSLWKWLFPELVRETPVAWPQTPSRWDLALMNVGKQMLRFGGYTPLPSLDEVKLDPTSYLAGVDTPANLAWWLSSVACQPPPDPPPVQTPIVAMALVAVVMAGALMTTFRFKPGKKAIPCLADFKIEKTQSGYRIDDAGFELLALKDEDGKGGMSEPDPTKNFTFSVTNKEQPKGQERVSICAYTSWRIPGIAPWFPDLKDPLNCLTGACHRIARTTPPPQLAAFRRLHLFIDMDMKRYDPVEQILPFTETVQGLSKPEGFKERLRDAHSTCPEKFAVSHPNGRRRARFGKRKQERAWYKIAGQGKWECYPDPKFQRGTYGQSDDALRADQYGWLGIGTKSVEKKLYPQIKSHVKNMTVDERMAVLKDLGRPAGANDTSDYTAFEASYAEEVFDHVLTPVYGHMLSRFAWKDEFIASMRATFVNLFIEFSCTSKRTQVVQVMVDFLEPSGVPGTAFNNFIFNHYVWKFNLYERHGISTEESDEMGLQEGDDTAWALEGCSVPESDFERFRLIVKMISGLSQSDVVFCQLSPLVESDGILGDPSRFLMKFFTVRPKDFGAKPTYLMALQRSKAMAARCLYRGAPIISLLAHRTDQLLRHISATPEMAQQYLPYGVEYPDHLPPYVPASLEARAIVEDLYGWTTEMQLHAERIIEEWQGGHLNLPPCYFSQSLRTAHDLHVRDPTETSSLAQANPVITGGLIDQLKPYAIDEESVTALRLLRA
jgi:hypothetical protein